MDGAVTHLSPYLSRGVISTRLVAESLVARGFSWQVCESLFKELAWRDYFQRVAQVKNLEQRIVQMFTNKYFLQHREIS